MLCKGYGSFHMEPNGYEFEIGGYTWTTAAPILVPTLPIHPLASGSTFGIAKRTKVLMQEKWYRQVSKQGAVRGQGGQTGFKTGKTGGTRQGGRRPIDPPSCAKTGVVLKKKVGQNASAQSNHLYIRANFTRLTAQKPQRHAQVRDMGCQKCTSTGGGLSASSCLAAPHAWL